MSSGEPSSFKALTAKGGRRPAWLRRLYFRAVYLATKYHVPR